MNVEDESDEGLAQLAALILDDITRISHEWHVRLPELKALLVQVENEVFSREKRHHD